MYTGGHPVVTSEVSINEVGNEKWKTDLLVAVMIFFFLTFGQ